MNNNLRHQKSIEVRKLREKFHIMAAHPPRYDPFSGFGKQAWDEWSQNVGKWKGRLEKWARFYNALFRPYKRSS